MRQLRYGLVMVCLVLFLGGTARAEVDVHVSFGSPVVVVDIDVPYFPAFIPVPGFPVYYAPRVYANYFFYDGLYWVYVDDHWYSSFWYNGPWWLTEPDFVPLFILRIPVFYYMRPPFYFYGWHLRRPPRWGEHWGHDWERRHHDWDRWDRTAVPAPAPLPLYQQRYSGDDYPRFEQQQELQERYYHYQPRDKAIRELVRKRVERTTVPSVPEREERELRRTSPAKHDDRDRLEQRTFPLVPPREERAFPPKSLEKRHDRRERDDARYSEPREQGGPRGQAPRPDRVIEDRQRETPPQRHAPAMESERQHQRRREVPPEPERRDPRVKERKNQTHEPKREHDERFLKGQD